jgi:predicted ferric reductase
MWGEWVVKMFYGANLKRQKAKKLKEKDVNCGPPPFSNARSRRQSGDILKDLGDHVKDLGDHVKNLEL